ncbi:transcriptional regulator [Brevibacillus laterosporus]|nr:transcriptional regulator [Brevibacillus laterosporus]
MSILPSRFVQQEKLQGKNGTLTRPTLLAYPAEKENDLRLASFMDWVIEPYDH